MDPKDRKHVRSLQEWNQEDQDSLFLWLCCLSVHSVCLHRWPLSMSLCVSLSMALPLSLCLSVFLSFLFFSFFTFLCL